MTATRYAYAMKDKAGAIKLGITTDVRRRADEHVRERDTAILILASTETAYGVAEESAMHTSLATHRAGAAREWYYPTIEVLRIVELIRRGYDVFSDYPAVKSDAARAIREARLSLGLSQVEFAVWLGSGLSTVQRWESGDCLPAKYVHVVALERLGVPLSLMVTVGEAAA